MGVVVEEVEEGLPRHRRVVLLVGEVAVGPGGRVRVEVVAGSGGGRGPLCWGAGEEGGLLGHQAWRVGVGEGPRWGPERVEVAGHPGHLAMAVVGGLGPSCGVGVGEVGLPEREGVVGLCGTERERKREKSVKESQYSIQQGSNYWGAQEYCTVQIQITVLSLNKH